MGGFFSAHWPVGLLLKLDRERLQPLLIPNEAAEVEIGNDFGWMPFIEVWYPETIPLEAINGLGIILSHQSGPKVYMFEVGSSSVDLGKFIWEIQRVVDNHTPKLLEDRDRTRSKEVLSIGDIAAAIWYEEHGGDAYGIAEELEPVIKRLQIPLLKQLPQSAPCSVTRLMPPSPVPLGPAAAPVSCLSCSCSCLTDELSPVPIPLVAVAPAHLGSAPATGRHVPLLACSV